jgi:glycosyltransferase involved in cell wall biosynthesis
VKLLSVLIPAFNYPEGVNNILHMISAVSDSQVEVIIGDDSNDYSVFNIVENYVLSNPGKISYKKNLPSLGAVKNWNTLLSRATGKYVILMHHDEFPISQEWISNLLLRLSLPNCPDVILMPCVLHSGMNSMLRIHLPHFFQKLIVTYFPTYLFRRNVFGPTSCLVIRRNIYPIFDENLRWFVDIDMYWRLLASTKSFFVVKDLKIGSISNRKNSITQSIASEVAEIRNAELNYLRKKYSNASIWLDPKKHLVISEAESMLWRIFKSLYVVYTKLLRIFGR